MKVDYTLQELPQIAGMILANASSKTLLFYGAMGVGKTTLIKELAKELGIQESISSPTFSIVNEYLLDSDKLYHFDFYRINSDEEIYDIGIEDYFDSSHWKMIEWPEKAEKFLPTDNTKIQLTINQNGSRTINIAPVN